MRAVLISLLLANPLIVAFWAIRTVALYLGSVSPGAQAPYFDPPPREPGRHEVSILSTRRVVPGPGLPENLVVQTANNNLDVVRHGGRVFLAFRTAPHHFASSATTIQVVSSEDETSWRSETSISIGSDVREPRFLSLGESLFLYVSKLGTDPLAFQPSGVLVTERGSDGAWRSLVDAGLPGRVLWRARVVGGRAVATVYAGGENIYDFNGRALRLELLTTTDGRHWASFEPQGGPVYIGGASEADLALLPDGRVEAVARNEAGDETGWGSLLCSAPALGLPWHCQHDSRKYDSPFVFEHDGEAYLVARRNVTESGEYDVGWGPRMVHGIVNELKYISTGKRCSLWRFAGVKPRMAFVLDLPSRGDTCFPAVLDGQSDDVKIVYDYSSDIGGADVAWSVGQRNPTFIYRHELRFSPRAP